VLRAARKEAQRLERAIARLEAREAELQEAMAEHASDHERLGEIDRELAQVASERDELETRWLEASAVIEE
jgi:ATP-binding cassette subfamily F protein uup